MDEGGRVIAGQQTGTHRKRMHSLYDLYSYVSVGVCFGAEWDVGYACICAYSPVYVPCLSIIAFLM